jgi:hypothetical protein
LNLAVPERIAPLQEAADEIETALVVDLAPVVSVREVERVDVPLAGRKALIDDLERELVGGGDLRAAALAEVEERVLVDLLGLGVVGDEDDLDLGVPRAEEPDHPEIEAAADVLLELAHRTGHVPHGNDDGVALLLDVPLPGLETEVVVVEPVEHRAAGPRVAEQVLADRAALV